MQTALGGGSAPLIQSPLFIVALVGTVLLLGAAAYWFFFRR